MMPPAKMASTRAASTPTAMKSMRCWCCSRCHLDCWRRLGAAAAARTAALLLSCADRTRRGVEGVLRIVHPGCGEADQASCAVGPVAGGSRTPFTLGQHPTVSGVLIDG